MCKIYLAITPYVTGYFLKRFDAEPTYKGQMYDGTNFYLYEVTGDQAQAAIQALRGADKAHYRCFLKGDGVGEGDTVHGVMISAEKPLFAFANNKNF